MYVFSFLFLPFIYYFNYEIFKNLSSFIKEKQFELSLDEINYTNENYFGIRVRYDEDFLEPNITKIHPSLDFKNQVEDEEKKLNGFDLEGEYITEINGKKTTSLNEEDFYKEFNKNIIAIKVENNPKTYQLEQKSYENFEIYFTADILNISSINSKNSNFYTIFDTETTWYDDRLSKAALKVTKDGIIKHNENNKIKLDNTQLEFGFICKIGIDFLSEIGYWIPSVIPEKFTPDDSIQAKKKYVIFQYNKSKDCDNCTDLEKKYGLSSFYKKNNYRGRIYNSMKLDRFPFDEQRLTYNFKVENEIGFITEVFHNSSEVIETNLTNLKNDEWNIKDGWNGYGHYYLTEFDIRLPLLSVHFDIERKSNYFFFKIMLPIIFLLIVAWSTFWINPKELESRVTVSIVCLLSLIAYNFVIDNDLPKLGYLTFMDKFVLTTYIFAGIPTLQTILCRHFVDHNKLETAKRIDKECKIYIPLSFFLALLFLVINYNIIDIPF